MALFNYRSQLFAHMFYSSFQSQTAEICTVKEVHFTYKTKTCFHTIFSASAIIILIKIWQSPTLSNIIESETQIKRHFKHEQRVYVRFSVPCSNQAHFQKVFAWCQWNRATNIWLSRLIKYLSFVHFFRLSILSELLLYKLQQCFSVASCLQCPAFTTLLNLFVTQNCHAFLS